MAGTASSPQSAQPPLANGHAAEGTPVAAMKPQIPNWDKFDACNSPGNALHMIKLHRKKKRKDESLLSAICAWTVDHQIGISLNFVILVGLCHLCFDKARPITRAFLQLSYYDPFTQRYTQGLDDFYFVAFWIFVFTGLRVAVMTYILLPIAQSQGITSLKKKVRFAEQGWLIVYYSVFWTLGMQIMYDSPYWLNFKELWTNFPSRSMDAHMKWYYLVQFAFWLQQIVVVNIEDRRKDYWQMFTHHIITCALLLGSYGAYQTRVGNAILCIMDIVDLTLPAAKILKYSGYQTACDIAFGVFVVSWFLARHVAYLAVCWSIYADIPQIITYGCYDSVTGSPLSDSALAAMSPSEREDIFHNVFQPFLNPDGPVCFTPRVHYTFLALLVALQGITILWFTMILRVAYRVVMGQGADDSRSDDEDEDEVKDADADADAEDAFFEENEAQPAATQELRPLEREVGVEGLNLRSRSSASPAARLRRAATGRAEARTGANGLSVVGGSSLGDRKELLGRIGCDKPS